MSAHEEQPNEASETYTAEWIDENCIELIPDLIAERIKANLEPFNAQISTLKQMMNKRIQDNSARTNPTEGPALVDFSLNLHSQTDLELPKPCH